MHDSLDLSTDSSDQIVAAIMWDYGVFSKQHQCGSHSDISFELTLRPSDDKAA